VNSVIHCIPGNEPLDRCLSGEMIWLEVQAAQSLPLGGGDTLGVSMLWQHRAPKILNAMSTQDQKGNASNT
jgi:hypothetical protein